MNIFIGDISAFEFWMSADQSACDRISTTRALPSGLTAHNETQALSLLQQRTEQESPVHVYLPRGGRGSSTPRIVFHRSNAVPPGAFVKVKKGVFLSSPEFNFCEMALKLSFSQLVLYGCELCSTFVRSSFSPTGIEARKALTSPEKLAQFASRPDVRGGRTALRAIRYVAANTASPMEAAVATLLSLPIHRGGYGLPLPSCNRIIEISPQAGDITSSEYFKADYCWPERKVLAEYDSNSFHTGSARIAHNAARRNALMALGFQVVVITHDQMLRPLETDRAARALAKALGIRMRKRTAAAVDKNASLRKAILNWAQDVRKPSW